MHSVTIEAWKIESHQTARDFLYSGLPAICFCLNSTSIRIADESAKRVQLPQTAVSAVQWAEGIAGQVRARLVATSAAARAADPRPPPESVEAEVVAVKRTKLEKAIANSSHTVSQRGKRFHCSKCGSSVSRIGLVEWLKSDCQTSRKRLAQEPNLERIRGLVTIGRKGVDPSHALVFDDLTGYFLCTSCGACGKKKLVKLAGRCTRAPTEAGEQVLTRIEAGLDPFPQRNASASALQRRKSVKIARDQA